MVFGRELNEIEKSIEELRSQIETKERDRNILIEGDKKVEELLSLARKIAEKLGGRLGLVEYIFAELETIFEAGGSTGTPELTTLPGVLIEPTDDEDPIQAGSPEKEDRKEEVQLIRKLIFGDNVFAEVQGSTVLSMIYGFVKKAEASGFIQRIKDPFKEIEITIEEPSKNLGLKKNTELQADFNWGVRLTCSFWALSEEALEFINDSVNKEEPKQDKTEDLAAKESGEIIGSGRLATAPEPKEPEPQELANSHSYVVGDWVTILLQGSLDCRGRLAQVEGISEDGQLALRVKIDDIFHIRSFHPTNVEYDRSSESAIAFSSLSQSVPKLGDIVLIDCPEGTEGEKTRFNGDRCEVVETALFDDGAIAFAVDIRAGSVEDKSAEKWMFWADEITQVVEPVETAEPTETAEPAIEEIPAEPILKEPEEQEPERQGVDQELEEQDADAFYQEMIAATDIEITRLAWTTNQGKEFLKERYGKKSRQLLTDNELVDFLNVLKAIGGPSPSDTTYLF